MGRGRAVVGMLLVVTMVVGVVVRGVWGCGDVCHHFVSWSNKGHHYVGAIGDNGDDGSVVAVVVGCSGVMVVVVVTMVVVVWDEKWNVYKGITSSVMVRYSILFIGIHVVNFRFSSKYCFKRSNSSLTINIRIRFVYTKQKSHRKYIFSRNRIVIKK